jgi:hypothetical protein
VEAAGVELITMLTARNLLILRTATTAKKATLPNSLYVYCTKMFLSPDSRTPRQRTKYRTNSPRSTAPFLKCHGHHSPSIWLQWSVGFLGSFKAFWLPALQGTDPTMPLLVGGQTFQINLIMPEPCPFLSRKLPRCSIIRPTETKGAAWERSSS